MSDGHRRRLRAELGARTGSSAHIETHPAGPAETRSVPGWRAALEPSASQGAPRGNDQLPRRARQKPQLYDQKNISNTCSNNTTLHRQKSPHGGGETQVAQVVSRAE